MNATTINAPTVHKNPTSENALPEMHATTMHATMHTLPAVDGHQICFKRWLHNHDQPRAIIHIVHGLAEHIHRYDPLAQMLVKQGFVVYAHNQRGHGETCPPAQLGHYADVGGWNLLLSDIAVLQREFKRQFPDIPLIIFGHSMGSFVTTSYLQQTAVAVDGAILSGSSYQTPLLYQATLPLLKLERLRVGPRGRSKFIDYLIIGRYNDNFKPSRTPSDWLSRNPVEVDKYIRDPLCGFISTTQLWIDLFNALNTMSKPANLQKIPRSLPIFILGGAEDPNGGQKGMSALAAKLKQAKINDVECRIYPGGRHEMLNETNRTEVLDDILTWLNHHFKNV